MCLGGGREGTFNFANDFIDSILACLSVCLSLRLSDVCPVS